MADPHEPAGLKAMKPERAMLRVARWLYGGGNKVHALEHGHEILSRASTVVYLHHNLEAAIHDGVLAEDEHVAAIRAKLDAEAEVLARKVAFQFVRLADVGEKAEG